MTCYKPPCEQECLDEASFLLSSFHAVIKDFESLATSKQLDVESTDNQQASFFDEGGQILPNDAIVRLFHKLVSFCYASIERLHEFQNWLIISKAKINTGNDMTTQARDKIISQANSIVVKLRQIINMADEYHQKRIDVGYVVGKLPNLRQTAIAKMQLNDRVCLSGVRTCLLSAKQLYMNLVALWVRNCDTIFRTEEADSIIC